MLYEISKGCGYRLLQNYSCCLAIQNVNVQGAYIMLINKRPYLNLVARPLFPFLFVVAPQIKRKKSGLATRDIPIVEMCTRPSHRIDQPFRLNKTVANAVLNSESQRPPEVCMNRYLHFH